MSATPRERIDYAVAALLILATEICIALFVHDRFVRPYLGDTLAVAGVYLALRAALPLRIGAAVALALAIAAAIEFGQWFGVVDRLGMRGNAVARIVLGTGFEWKDFLAYAAGGLIVLAVETSRRR